MAYDLVRWQLMAPTLPKVTERTQLIDFGGTAESCPVCNILNISAPPLPFQSDADAVAHMAQHEPAELAWALLGYKARIHAALATVDASTGPLTADDLDDGWAAVDTIAYRPGPQ